MADEKKKVKGISMRGRHLEVKDPAARQRLSEIGVYEKVKGKDYYSVTL